ncbi:MAG: NAD(P)-binding domain-containing protein [Pseudomonadota bacterium]
MQKTTVAIVGAGQAGLSMSRALSALSVDHVVLERGEIGNAWRTQRWDSVRMLTPNWANQLPGTQSGRADPDGYMRASEFADLLTEYARQQSAPVIPDCEVGRVRRAPNGYVLETSHGAFMSDALVMATGAASLPALPALARAVPTHITQITPDRYRNPDDVPGRHVLVVGASASGVQIARELQLAGRQVTLSVGTHMRLPRRYRGRDIEHWLTEIGLLDERAEDIADLPRARRLPSPQLMAGECVDLNALQEIGVDIVGRLSDVRDGAGLFSGGLSALTASADLKMDRTLDLVDAHLGRPDRADRPSPTRVPATPRLSLPLSSGAISTIVWATGFKPDFSWLDIDLTDRRGRLMHDRGVCPLPGLFVLGLPILRRRRSHHISGAVQDAQDIAQILRSQLDASRAA